MSKDNASLEEQYPWISLEFLQNILRQKFKIYNIIENYSVKPALARGENYCSQLIRITINYALNFNKKSMNLIIKADAIGNDEMSTELHMFLKEITVYQEIMPKVESLLSKIDDSTKFGPTCYDSGTNPCYIVFEDLKANKYKNVDRRFGLKYENYEHILIKLAKWHAATAMLGVTNLSLMRNHMQSHITEKSGFLVLLENSLIACSEAIKNWKGFEDISLKLKNLRTRFVQKSCDAFTRNDNNFNVLIHGDLWSNNIMFKTNENTNCIEDVVFVDYALGFWGSPGIDLSYTFFTSSDSTVQENDWDNLLQLYYKHLKSSLIVLKYPKRIPNLIDIQIEILKCGIYPVILSLILYGARNLENVEHGSMSLFIGNSEENKARRIELLQKPECRAGLEYLLKYYNRKGYFD